MNKADLINVISKDISLTRDEITQVVNKLIQAMQAQIRQGGAVRIQGLGTFDIKQRKATVGRDFQSGSLLRVPPKATTVFRPSSKFNPEQPIAHEQSAGAKCRPSLVE